MSWDYYLATHWFAALLLVVALVLAGLVLLRRLRRRTWSLGLAGIAAACALAGLGGLVGMVLPPEPLHGPPLWAWIVGGVGLGLFAVLALVLVLTGFWSRWLAVGAGALLAVSAGGLCAGPVSEGLRDGVKLARSVEFLQPWWLLLLLLIPVLIFLSYRSLAGLGPIRRWVALGLRCALVLFLVLALSEARLRHQSEHTTVLFLLDRSLSIPEEPETDSRGLRVDLRWERLRKFINDAVEERGSGHERDKAGLIVFGRRPRLELPPSDAPRFNFTEVAGTIDGNYTDIGAAIKLALASFPENTGKRIVLLSDGNENLGDAVEQAKHARENGVQIDVVPLAAGQRAENEVLVHSIEAPALIEQGSQLPIRVVLRSYNPNIVVGTLTVKQISEGVSVDVPGSPKKNVALQPGLNSFTFKQPIADEQHSYTYEADFLPEFVVNDKGEVLSKGLPGDRPQNNRASTHVVARGQRRVLLVEPKIGDHQSLVDDLQSGATKFQVERIDVDKLPADKDKLAVLLSNYDCVILANVAASDVPEGNVGDNVAGAITETQQEVIRSNTHDQGCGLVMIGGPNSFGAGGWQGTPVEKALPVDCDIKSLEVQGKGGLVLIMHASEMAQGNYWQKQIAKLAIKKLTAGDEVGILYYDFTAGVKWHIPLQVIGDNRPKLLAKVDSLIPGDMPDFDPALKMAYDALTDPKRELATKHVILISDGDPMQNDKNLLTKMRSARVTCTTVGVATHGAPQDQALASIAQATKGRFYNVKSASALPEIYTKETRLVSQSYVYENKKGFGPRIIFRGGPTEKLPDALPPLYGFVRTTPKQGVLVEIPIMSPPIASQDFPLLAYWHYGLGKAVAFTSDARTRQNVQGWDKDWYQSPMYGKFWEQLLEWSLRPVESKRLLMTTEYKDGKVKVTVEARDEGGKPIINLDLRGGVTTPGSKADDPRRMDLKFEQKASGQYEAEFKADEAGSYFVSAQAVRKVKVKDKEGNVKGEVEEGYDSVRSGVTIPYSPEFADLESNTALLERLRAMTDGQTYADNSDELAKAARSGAVFRPGLPRFYSLQPVWYWLLALTGVLLFFDVAVRRIAVDPLQVTVAAQQVWDRLRGRRTTAERAPEFIERLRSRKAQVGESMQRERAARRFDAGDVPVAPPAGAADVPAAPSGPPRPARPPASLGPQQPEQEPADFASRLMKAKKRVWEEREKDKGKGEPGTGEPK
jgi:uncharacterized membrane protein